MRRKRNGFGTFVFTIFILALIAGAGFIYVSPAFEQNKPVLEFSTKNFWNLKDKLQIKISDESSIKHYKVTFMDSKNNIVLVEQSLNNNTLKEQIIEVTPPKLDLFYKDTVVKIRVEATDNSKWNLLNGNTIDKTFDIKVDKKKLIASIIANSKFIKRGGSAVAIVKVSDDNLKEAYISFNDEVKFRLTPFYKDNYFISLIAWPMYIEDFSRVSLVAIDEAGNKKVTKIPLYLMKTFIKNDTIKISKKFINEVSKKVLKKSEKEIPQNYEDIFIAQNKVVRQENIDFLKKLADSEMDYSKRSSFKLKIFKRMHGSIRVAGYAERRSYIFNGDKIDQEWHLGIDMAKVKHSKVISSNEGNVIFNSYLGIYGNTIIIDHGLGLASLYAHTSSINVKVGQKVYPNSRLGKTGTSGAVLGDHLHFGILVQGYEVDPVEWMDRRWLKKMILNVVKSAKDDISKK